MRDSFKFLVAALFVTLINAVCCCTTSAQTTIIAKFIVQDARKNQVDITDGWVKDGGYLAIYTYKDDDRVYLANVNHRRQTQSFGPISDTKITTVSENSDTYENKTFDFKWSYANSYDAKLGTSTVRLLTIKKDAGVTFSCTIVTEDLDVLMYRGYVEGSLSSIVQ